MAEEKRDPRYGSYDKDKDELVEAQVSILTGRPIGKDGSIREAVPGTSFFYRFEGTAAHLVTDAHREEWRNGVPGGRKPSPFGRQKSEPAEG